MNHVTERAQEMFAVIEKYLGSGLKRKVHIPVKVATDSGPWLPPVFLQAFDKEFEKRYDRKVGVQNPTANGCGQTQIMEYNTCDNVIARFGMLNCLIVELFRVRSREATHK